MASKLETRKATFETLAKGAYLDVLLPKASHFDAASLIEIGSADELAKAPMRRNLFFDERTTIFLVLRTSASDEDVRNLLPDLETNVTAHATDAVPSSSGHAASVPGKHDIATSKMKGDESAAVVSSGDHTYVIWKIATHLSRPRARLQRPAVYFSATLGLAIPSITQRDNTIVSTMIPYQASPRNILEPLANAHEFQDKQIYLAEDRITKVAPRTSNSDTSKPIRGATKRAFPIMPAIFARVRFSSLPDGVIASLHLETLAAMVGTAEVSAVEIKVLEDPGKTVSYGSMAVAHSAKTISCLTDAVLPLKLSAGDEQVLLYRIATDSAAATLGINIQATMTPEEGSQIDIAIESRAKIDAKPMADDTTCTWSKMKPMTGEERIVLPPRTESLPPHAKASNVATTQTSQDGNVSFMISAPENVTLSKDFALKVKCINNSTRERFFSFQPVQQRPAVLRAHSKTSAPTRLSLAKYRDTADVFYHTPVAKSGPIRAHASCEVALSLSPCILGVLDLGRLRIVDLSNSQMVEIKELPDITCLEVDEENDGPEQNGETFPPVDAEAGRKEDEFWDMVHKSWAVVDGT